MVYWAWLRWLQVSKLEKPSLKTYSRCMPNERRPAVWEDSVWDMCGVHGPPELPHSDSDISVDSPRHKILSSSDESPVQVPK